MSEIERSLDIEYYELKNKQVKVVEYVLTTDDRVVNEKYVSDTFDVEWLIDSGDLDLRLMDLVHYFCWRCLKMTMVKRLKKILKT